MGTNPKKIRSSSKLQIINKQKYFFEFVLHFYNYLAVNGLNSANGLYSAKKNSIGGIGDGACDGVLNVPAYQYDLGDCCKPLKNAICNYEDDCICHMFTDFHGSILNFKMSLFF